MVAWSPRLVDAYLVEQRLAASRGARVLARCALALVPFFAFLDTVMFPEHQPLFFIFRLATLLVAAATLALLRTPLGRRWPLVLGVAIPLAIGLDVDAMTAVAGRETSPYYAGVFIVLLGASLMLPWPPSWALAVSSILVGAYVAGIVAGGPIGEVPLFATNVALLATTAILVVVGAAVSDRLRRREFESRMRLDEHARRQSALAKLGQLALSSAGSRALIEDAVVLVAETLSVGRCALLMRRPEEQTLLLQAGAGWEPDLLGGAIVDACAGSQARYVLESAGAVVVETLATEERFAPSPLLTAHGAVSTIAVAIGGRDRPVGILEAAAQRPTIFAKEEVDFVEAVASVLTTAIAHEQAEAALTDEVRTSTALARVGRELISSLERPVLLERLCQLTADVLGADYSTTWLWDTDAKVFAPSSCFGLPPDQWEALRVVRLPPRIVAHLLARMRSDELVYITPSSSEFPMVAKLVERHGAAFAACFAFRRGNEVIGVQVAGFRGRVERFTPHEERLARGIAQLAWMALTNARLVEELEQASRLKSEFVSTMSHELRTPLNVIMGYTDMLADESYPEDRRKLLGQIRKSSVQLLEMVEATLDLSRIAAGKDQPRFELVAVRGLWEELRTEFAVLPCESGVTVRWEPVEDTDLYTDRRKLKIVVKNLVGNALKFTPGGEVVVSSENHGGVWALTVRDTGIGIPREQLALIFDIFRQVDSSDARPYGGVGLGLFIVRSLLAQLGGEIHVESEAGVGSTFTVTLPAAFAKEASAPVVG